MPTLGELLNKLDSSATEFEAEQAFHRYMVEITPPESTVSKPQGALREKARSVSQLVLETGRAPILLHRQLMVQGPQLSEQLCSELDLACALFEHRCRNSLTGLSTHTEFHHTLAAEIDRCERAEQFLTVLIVDIDHFHQLNQKRGHGEGDLLLQKWAQIFPDPFEPDGTCYRLGADEFAVLLPEADKLKASRLAESLRADFQQRYGSDGITLSVGLANFPVDARSMKDLLKAGDDALYMAKRGGRNRVAVSANYEERHAPPIVRRVKEKDSPDPDDQDDPLHSSPRIPPPKGTSGGNARKLGDC